MKSVNNKLILLLVITSITLISCGSGSDDNVSKALPDAESGFYTGAGLYQTGFHIVQTDLIFSAPASQSDDLDSSTFTDTFTTDSVANEISNTGIFLSDLSSGTFLSYKYDSNGRVVEYYDGGSGTFTPDYNADGTINTISRADPINGPVVTKFNYTDGRLTSKVSEWENPNGSVFVQQNSYIYDENNVLLRKEDIDLETGLPYPDVNEFTLDEAGRIVEVRVMLGGSVHLRLVSTYDTNNNITQQDLFSGGGSLNRSIVNTYAENTEPTPNVFGFVAATGAEFIDLIP